MEPIKDRHDEIIEKLSNRTIREPVKISNCVNCTIMNCDISSDDSEHMFVLWNCRGCKVINSKFHDKRSSGCAVKVDGEGVDEESIPNGNVFEGCTWENLSRPCEEPLRIGDSRRSHLSYNTTIRNCKFINLNADKETISIKSCGNTIENCEHINCESSITIRHGHTNTIQDCTFIGEHGGIRVYGKDNKILRNTFKENKSKEHYPLRLYNAEKDKERNDGSSKTGSEHTDHTQVINNEIIGNTFDNCDKCVRWGEDNGQYKPKGVKFKNNKVIAEKVQSQVIEFLDDEAKAEDNDFADNEVVGTRAIIDSKIAAGFKPPIRAQK